ncbi:MAG: cobalamin-dependent protein, partial [Candidatus Woesearchaeota archaeon]|nr:cobalamin-dependent protein [Candidatus Woesearchaeota archaeon]
MKLALISVNQNDADPPLGIAYISSYIKKYAKHPVEIKIIDKEDTLLAIRKNHFDIIGIAALSTDLHKAQKLAKEIIKLSPSSYLVIGGVHITIMPQHLKDSAFDIGIIGEGEQTLLEICELFSERRELPLEDLSKINGLVFKDKNSNLITTQPRAYIKNLDDIPFPDRDSLKMKEIYLVP